MTGVAIGVIFLSYGFGLWGYCLLKDYDVNLYQLFSSTWPPPKFESVGRVLPGTGIGTGTGTKLPTVTI